MVRKVLLALLVEAELEPGNDFVEVSADKLREAALEQLDDVGLEPAVPPNKDSYYKIKVVGATVADAKLAAQLRTVPATP